VEIRGSLRAEFIETPSAKEAVLFSNTASFLLSRLQKDSSVSYVSHELRTEEILEYLEWLCKMSPANPLYLLWCYVFLAALSPKDDLRGFKDRLNAIDLSHVQWGDEIRRVISEERTSSNFLGVQYESGGKKNQGNVSTNTASGVVAQG
jgi:hypothetical protein